MNFEHCIRCTICVENCPVFRVNPDFPGPKQAGPDAQRFRSDREKSEDEWVLLCSQCKRCEMACPCGVEPAQIILRAQQRYGLEHPHTPAHLLFANNYYLCTLGFFYRAFANRFAATKTGKKIFRRLGIATYIPFPKFSFGTLRGEKKTRSREASGKLLFFTAVSSTFTAPISAEKSFGCFSRLRLMLSCRPSGAAGCPLWATATWRWRVLSPGKMPHPCPIILMRDMTWSIPAHPAACVCCMIIRAFWKYPQAKKIAENSYDLHEYISQTDHRAGDQTQLQEVQPQASLSHPLPPAGAGNWLSGGQFADV